MVRDPGGRQAKRTAFPTPTASGDRTGTRRANDLRSRVRRVLPMVLALASVPVAGVPDVHAQDRVLRASRRDQPIQIDGHLDEADWRTAEVATGFVERRPVPGDVPPVTTSFQVLYDEGALYVGIRCGLAPGETPRGVELTRDNFRIFDDDAVSVKLDVRHDRRTTNGFAVSAAGTQLDYVATDNGQSFRNEFDAVWESAVHVARDAWYVEMRLPVTALGTRETDGRLRVMGLNVTRDHNATRGTYDWSAIPVELGAVSATHYGELHVEAEDGGLDGGRPLVLIPYLLASYREDDETRFPSGTPWQLGAGGTARLRLAEDTWSELTLFTDFAQVDLDDPQVNLDRFPLFFPEKRPFFLSGLDVFEFDASDEVRSFFTRTIGLDEDREEVLMWGGLKLYGRARLGEDTALSYGLLDVLTGEDALTNDTVARLRLNLGDASYVGAITTLRATADHRPDSTVGLDFFARALGGKLQIRGFGTGVFNEPEPEEDGEPIPDGVERDGAARLSLAWTGRVWRPSLSLTWIGGDFAPRLGFVRRRGIAQATGALTIQHRTSALGLENVDVILRAQQIFDDELREDLGRYAGPELAIGWVSGMYLYARADYVEDVVQERFDLVDAEIQPGRYAGVRTYIGLSRASARNPSFSLDYVGQASFFGGTRQGLSGSVAVVATRHLRVAASGNASWIKLPELPGFETFAGSLSATVAPSTQVQLDGIYQINTVSRTMLTLARIRWRYLPGSDLFLVYRERRPYGSAKSDPDLQLERRVTLKINLRYDALL